MMEIKRYEIDYIENESPEGEYVRYDDVSPLLAERDPTPVDAEWLDGVMESKACYVRNWVSPDGRVQIEWGHWVWLQIMSKHGEVESEIKNPTRGQVLTALRLFGER